MVHRRRTPFSSRHRPGAGKNRWADAIVRGDGRQRGLRRVHHDDDRLIV
jgi:hypothetical protein